MIKIKRTYLPTATCGDATATVDGQKPFTFKTLELPWKENQRMVSCIPAGTYEVVKRQSQKYGVHFHITNVPNRDMILIHNANHTRELLGCIAVGVAHAHIDGDGIPDVTSSRQTMERLVKLLPNKFTLEIT